MPSRHDSILEMADSFLVPAKAYRLAQALFLFPSKMGVQHGSYFVSRVTVFRTDFS